MTQIFQAQIEYRIDDDDDLTIKVTTRHGRSGENPPVEVLHDSHFPHDARQALSKGVRQMEKLAILSRAKNAGATDGKRKG